MIQKLKIELATEVATLMKGDKRLLDQNDPRVIPLLDWDLKKLQEFVINLRKFRPENS